MNDSFASQAAGYLEMSNQWENDEKSEKVILCIKYLFAIKRISLQNKNDFHKYLETFKIIFSSKMANFRLFF